MKYKVEFGFGLYFWIWENKILVVFSYRIYKIRIFLIEIIIMWIEIYILVKELLIYIDI